MTPQKNKPLTFTMLSLLAFMREQHGEIHRHPGGFWTTETWSGRPSYGTASIESLVDRGLAEYTQYKAHREIIHVDPRQAPGAGRGDFPITARLTAAGMAVKLAPAPSAA